MCKYNVHVLAFIHVWENHVIPFPTSTQSSSPLMSKFLHPLLQGSIEAPNEFAESLVHGVLSMLGHAVGSVAQLVTLITGSLSRALVMLSFDKVYSQVVHPQTLNKQTVLALC